VRYRRRASGKKSHGALWSIIYIDLMTQIMAFFVIVWSVEHGTKVTQTPALGTGVGMGDQTVRMVDLPGDVLFASGQTAMAADGRVILDKLFGDADSGVLSFDQGGLAQRKLVIHGHTDERARSPTRRAPRTGGSPSRTSSSRPGRARTSRDLPPPRTTRGRGSDSVVTGGGAAASNPTVLFPW
jgi:flagellar motor protein MotB